MKQFKQYITEADTAESTTYEAALCVAYNMRKGDSYEEALESANISTSEINKIEAKKDTFLSVSDEILNNVTEDFGPRLVHSGRADSKGVNYYGARLNTGATNTTPKADFIGDKSHQVSLKKMSGAVIMSHKSGEAEGVVRSAILHYENAKGKSYDKEPAFKKAMGILQNEMVQASNYQSTVQIGQAKAHFRDWYISYTGKDSRIADVLKQLDKKPKAKKLEKHLKAELNILRVTKVSPTAHRNLLDGVKPLTAQGMEKYFDAYKKSTKANKNLKGSVEIGGIQVKDHHIYVDGDPTKGVRKDAYKEMIKVSAIKEQVVETLKISMATLEWQNELVKWANTNEELKKWIVYEASTGHFKFTGEVASGDYTGSTTEVANMLMAFDEVGKTGKLYKNMVDWSGKHTASVGTISISYKGGGVEHKYLKVGMGIVGDIVDSVVNHEGTKLMEELDAINKEMLNEGVLDMLRTTKDWAKRMVNKVQNAWKKFVNFVYEKIILRIKSLINEGLNKFFDAFGIDVGMTKMKAINP